MQVFLSELAESKLLRLSEYLLEEWDLKTRDRFFEKLSARIKQISIQPDSCPRSKEFDNLYKCVVTKHTTFYYRILYYHNEIEIITILDTRQHPDNLTREL